MVEKKSEQVVCHARRLPLRSLLPWWFVLFKQVSCCDSRILCFVLAACVRTYFRTGDITSTTFLETIFSNETFDIDGMTFGPYINSTQANEYCNVGLRQTYLWVMDESKNLTYADPLPWTHPGCGNIYGLFFPLSSILCSLTSVCLQIFL